MPVHDIPASRQTLAARLERLLSELQQPPHPGSLPLRVADARCGWISPDAQSALAAVPGCARAGDEWRIGHGTPPGPALDARLRAAAEALRDAGCLRGWRDELLDVFDEDRLLGAIERAAMRPLGMLTRAVHLNAWSPAGELWIARRALDKATDPGMWDTLVGGLVGSGETTADALLRECAEEAGLEPPELARRSGLRVIGRIRRRIPEGYQVEEVLTSDCVLGEHVRPANRDGEVMEIRTAPVGEVLDMIEAGLFTREAMLVLFEDILRRSDG